MNEQSPLHLKILKSSIFLWAVFAANLCLDILTFLSFLGQWGSFMFPASKKLSSSAPCG